MKLKNIIFALLVILLSGAIITSIVAIGNISNGITSGDNSKETSKGDSSGSSDKTDGSEDPAETSPTPTSSLVFGSTVTTGTKPADKVIASPDFYKVSGESFARRIDNVTYYGIRYSLPADAASTLYVDFKDLALDGFSCVYRFSFDGNTWYVLKNYQNPDVNSDLQALIKNNVSRSIYISAFAVTGSTSDLTTTLAQFETLFTADMELSVSNVNFAVVG